MLPPLEVLIEATTTAFDRAMDGASERVEGFRGRTQRAGQTLTEFGNRTEAIGRRMSFISGAVIAGGVGMFAFANSTANSARELDRFARSSNSSVEEFQRMAAGARSVGMEQDELSDIFRDVNDRIGDFMSTGAGPLADFFENIGPQIGVTIDDFARLSGPEALQLYVNSLEEAGASQQEMTFYMEALAGNASDLIPLLENNGERMRDLGDAAAESGSLMDEAAVAAGVEFAGAMDDLRNAMSGAGNEIGAALLPMMTDLVEAVTNNVLPAIMQVADRISDWVTAFRDLPGPVQEAAAVIGTALGAGGPILIGIGLVSRAMGALIAATGPVGLFIAAAATLYAAWQIWGDDIMALLTQVGEFFQTKFNEIIEFLEGLPARFFEFGAAIVQGLLDGINAVWENLRARILELGELLPQWLRDRLGIASPSRVMHEIGTQIGQGLAGGISDTQGMIASAMQNATAPIENTAMNAANQVIGAMGQMFQGSKPIAIAQALINTFQGITEALKLPFPASLGAAAQVAAQGFAAISSIRSTTPSGGGGGGGGAQAVNAAPQVQTQNVMIDLMGASPQQVNQFQMFADTFNEAQRQGLMANVLVRGV